MNVPHRLSSGLPDVDADVVPGRRVAGVEPRLHLGEELPDGRLLLSRQIEEPGNVAPRDDQRVAWVDRESVLEGDGQVVLGKEVTEGEALAEGAGRRHGR